MANCKCYTCLKHSESYVAHLTACYELNAKILLSIHNLQMYVDYLNTFDWFMYKYTNKIIFSDLDKLFYSIANANQEVDITVIHLAI